MDGEMNVQKLHYKIQLQLKKCYISKLCIVVARKTFKCLITKDFGLI